MRSDTVSRSAVQIRSLDISLLPWKGKLYRFAAMVQLKPRVALSELFPDHGFGWPVAVRFLLVLGDVH